MKIKLDNITSIGYNINIIKKEKKMSDEVIRYGAGGVPYVKKRPAPKKEEVKEEVISEINKES